MTDQSNLMISNVVSLRDIKPPEPSTSKKITKPESEKLLLKFIRNLLHLKENETVEKLTNAQLLEILMTEFNISVTYSHNLEIEIYLTVLKKFLKMWPRWDVFEQFVQKAKLDPNMDLEAKLYEEYLNLKTYLQSMLEASKNGAKEAVRKSNQNAKSVPYLAAQCTLDQLHHLFFQKPNKKNAIFNVKPIVNKKIQINREFTLDEVLNWPNMSIMINTGSLIYNYYNTQELHHTLVNKKLNKATSPPLVPKGILISKRKGSKANERDDYNVPAMLRGKLSRIYANTLDKDLKVHIYTLILNDLKNLPKLNQNFIYKYYLNKHPYVRYFRNKVDDEATDTELYDLELEEMYTPSKTMFIETTHQAQDSIAWLKVTCLTCTKTFSAANVFEMKQHFNENHCYEGDLSCVNCSKTFEYQALAGQGWKHNC